MIDEEIIILYENRSERAIEETKFKYSRLICSVANHILHNFSDVEECENDTYFGMWKTIPPQKPKNFKAYILKITRNLSLKKYNYNHAKKRDKSLCVSYDELEQCIDGLLQQNDSRLESDLSEELNLFIETLSPENRKVFLLHYWYFMSVKEIMFECDMSKSKVESILFRTRKKLRIYLEERPTIKSQ